MTRRYADLRALSARFVIALASAFLLIGCAVPPMEGAPEPNQAPAISEGASCFAPEWQAEAYRDAVLSLSEGARYGELTEEERQSFLTAYNTSGPPTAVMYQRIGFFEHPKAHTVMVAFIEDGCVWTTGVLPRALFFAMSQRGGV